MAKKNEKVFLEGYRLYLALTLTALGLIIILQNTASVETRFLLFSFNLPQVVLLALTFTAGTVVGILLCHRRYNTPARRREQEREGEEET